MTTGRPVSRDRALNRRYAQQIVDLVESVEARCMAVDGPVTATAEEIGKTELEKLLRAAWLLARRVLKRPERR